MSFSCAEIKIISSLSINFALSSARALALFLSHAHPHPHAHTHTLTHTLSQYHVWSQGRKTRLRNTRRKLSKRNSRIASNNFCFQPSSLIQFSTLVGWLGIFSPILSGSASVSTTYHIEYRSATFGNLIKYTLLAFKESWTGEKEK